MTNIEKFDPSTLMEGVRDRIKATFVSLIPDEQWEQLVQKEVDDFFKIQKRDYYNKEHFSNFSMVCFEVMREVAKEKVIVFLKEYENQVWDSNKLKPGDKVKEIIIDNAPEILNSLIGSRVQQIINDMKNRGY